MKTFRKFVESKKITEATSTGDRRIDLGNTSGVLKLELGNSGVFLEMWAGGNGFRDVWKNSDFSKKLDEYYTTRDKNLEKELEKEINSLQSDILKAANLFDKEIERAMNKHGFRK